MADSFAIEAVITKPTAPHQPEAPVISLSKELGLSTFLPQSRSELSALFANVSFKSRVGVVVDYGLIIANDVLNEFPLGIINSHFSLLPEWRGADPITFALLSGQEDTGVSLMRIVERMDEGELLAQDSLHIESDMTGISLTEELIRLSNTMLNEHLPRYCAGDLQPFPQPDTPVTYSRKLAKADGRIDWAKPAAQIEREIRAFQPWPGSFTELNCVALTIQAASVLDESGKPGTYELSRNKLIIYCGIGALSINRLKPAGKGEIDIVSFLNGYRNKL